ncbi:hypothetical protein FRC12_008648 [Ceratobasidium sp. 428]|nr:hypothetical protein FRC12_008648 [Ceratobasidium sp. 428]
MCRFSAGEFIYDDEQLIMEFMAELCYDKHKKITGATDCSGYRLKQANMQDSELAVTVAASKLSTGFLSLRLSYYFFLWAADCSDDLRPDLMISLLKAAMSRLWRTLDPAEDNLPLAFLRLRGVVQLPKAILVYVTSVVSVDIRLSTTVQTSYSPLIDAALNHNIFALLFRALMFPLPYSYNSLSPSEQKSLDKMLSDLLEFVEEFGGFLSTICPFSIKALQESHADWLKAAQHLDEHCHMYHDTSQFARTHVSRCRTVWVEVGSFLFPNQLDGRSVPCSYPRCPYPTPLGGASFVCENCRATAYCGYRCQNS